MYDYEATTGMYDTKNSTAKFNKVTMQFPGNGHIEKYFYNDTNNNGRDLNSNYDKLDGRSYRMKVYDASSRLLSDEKMKYGLFHNNRWPVGIYYPYLIENEKDAFGVVSKKEFSTDLSNGLVKSEEITGVENKEKSNSTRFAHDYDPYKNEMRETGLYMLAQPCEMITNGFGPAVGGGSQQYRAKAVTWAKNLGCATWAPHQTYEWKIDCDEDGISKTNFSHFDFENLASNISKGWVCIQTNTQYNGHGIAIEQSTTGPNGHDVYSAAVYRNDLNMSIGSIVNSKFDEFAVFTCDYNLDEDGFFDKQNGWDAP